MKSLISWGIAGSILIIVAGVGAYIWKFYDHSWSNDPAVWGQLGDYLNMYVSAASLILVSMLTYVIHNTETNREEAQRREEITRIEERDKEESSRAKAKEEDEKARDRPILAFMVEIQPGGRKYWKVKNISQNVALNPLIAIDHGDGIWTYPVKIYSLGAGETLTLHWFLSVNRICAVYYDIRGNVLTSTIQDDRVKIDLGVNVLGHIPDREQIRWENAVFQG